MIAADSQLRIYSREGPGEWSEISLSDDADEVDGEKALMLEEIYGQRADGAAEPDDSRDFDEDADEDEDEDPELEADASGDAEEDEEDEGEQPDEKPARGRRAAASRG
ncbi:MAG TPA: hypothetical protein VGI50_08095 [Solirubrobacteraceae bacterium]